MSSLLTIVLTTARQIPAEAIRFPHRRRHKREWQRDRLRDNRLSVPEHALDLLALCEMAILPPLENFAGCLDFAAESWPLRRAHRQPTPSCI